MKILSLYDGMSCGMLAFKKLGIPIERYVAYEIDKYAIIVSSHNFPEIEHKGDVFEGDFTEYEGFDFLIGGSPCTYWSIAKSADKRETTASGMGWELFQQYVRGLKEAKPKYFIYENNKSMSAEIRASISEAFGFEPICINSALVSAQNRERLYWVGERERDHYVKVDVHQPTDKGILLRDILDTVEENVYAVGRHGRPVNTTATNKARTLIAGYGKMAGANFVTNPGFQATGIAEETPRFETRISVSTTPDKSPTVPTNSTNPQCSVAYPLKLEKSQTPEKSATVSASPGDPHVQVAYPFHTTSTGKSQTLRSRDYKMGLRDMIGNDRELRHGVAVDVTHKDFKKFHTFVVKDNIVTYNGRSYPLELPDGEYVIRKFSVPECKRLQTVPPDYDMTCISNTQAYRCLGNGWTIDVIAHLISEALKDKE